MKIHAIISDFMNKANLLMAFIKGSTPIFTDFLVLDLTQPPVDLVVRYVCAAFTQLLFSF